MSDRTRPCIYISTVFGLIDVDLALGVELGRRSYPVRWIVSRDESAAALRRAGVEPAAIVSLAVSRSEVRQALCDTRADAAAASLVRAFGPSGDPYRFLMLDRFAAQWPGPARLHYGGLLATRIRAALDAVSDFVIIGEPSSLTDWFLSLYARRRGQLFCSLHTVRYPYGRIGCFAGIDDSTLLPLVNGAVSGARPSMESVIESRPDYYGLDSGDMGQRGLLEWPSRIRLLHQNSDEMADFSLKERILRRLRRIVHREYLSRAFRFDALDGQRPYVLFPLQVQPEMVVDVCNPEFRDQLRTVSVIRRLLSPAFDLVVKEHHSQLGCRGPGFYRAVRKIPDVRVMSPKADGRVLARNAAAVVSVSGTMLLEAAMVGVPAIALSPIFFGVHEGVHIVRNVDELAAELGKLPITPLDPARLAAANRAWLDWVLARSRRAEYGELIYYPRVLDPRNVSAIADVLTEAAEGWRGGAVRSVP